MSRPESPSLDRAGHGRRPGHIIPAPLAAVLALALLAGPAAAGTITLTVDATLSNAFGDLSPTLGAGSIVSGTIELDDTVVGAFTPSGNPTFVRSEMLYAGAIVSSNLTIGGFAVSGTGGNIRVLDAATGQLAGEDNYEINVVIDTGTIGDATPTSLQLIPEYGDATITLSGTDPLFAPPAFDELRFNPVSLASAGGGSAFGQMDGLTSTGGPTTPSVPSTNPWLLFGLAMALGGVGLAALGRREEVRF